MGDKQILGPLYNIPEHMVKRYTMGGRVPIINQFYWGEFAEGTITWTKEQYRQLMEAARDCYENEIAKSYESDVYLVRLLKRHSLVGKTVLIIGSESPFYEALVTYMHGVPTTVEYRNIAHDIEGLSTYTVDEFEILDLQFDCALSVSSIEHSGLGRYGDPLDPDGDLKAMEIYRRHIKTGGLLFLQVPVGPDALVWNAHRVYGPSRLGVLFGGWQLIEAEGFDQSMFKKRPLGWHDQPAFVLRKPL